MRSYPVEELVSSLQKSLSDEMERYTLVESKYYDLKKQLDEAVKVIEYYADVEYWRSTCGDDQDYLYSESGGCKDYVQGKKAREFLQKMKEKV